MVDSLTARFYYISFHERQEHLYRLFFSLNQNAPYVYALEGRKGEEGSYREKERRVANAQGGFTTRKQLENKVNKV